MAKNKPQEKAPEVIENLEEEKVEEEKKNLVEVIDYEGDINLRDLIGKVLVLTHAEIQEGTQFNVIRLTFEENGKTLHAYTTSKAIENTVRKLLDKGLNNGKAFRVCITTRKNRYNTQTLVFASPSECEKK